MRALYPLSAIVGQSDLLLALTVCAVSPTVGGLLIRGDKGSAKSTAARALSEVLAPIERIEGCRYNCEPGLPTAVCEICPESETAVTRQNVPFVNLPLGVSEERLVGTLDLDKMLSHSRKAFQPGLLAASHRGILYIDEINLLADHLVDLLLDAAAMGNCVVERDGFSISHPARITLIGTMNPEEGELRPQLLDRFGLMVDVKAPTDPQTRADVVRRRLSFEKGPEAFRGQWQAEQEALRRRIASAKALVDKVVLSDAMLLCASTICAEMGIASLRADIVMGQVARTLASLDGREHVNLEDLKLAARLALPHRKRSKPGERCGIDQNKLDDILERSRPEELKDSELKDSELKEKAQQEKEQSSQGEGEAEPDYSQELTGNCQPESDAEFDPKFDHEFDPTHDPKSDPKPDGEPARARFAVAALPHKISLEAKDLGSETVIESKSTGSHSTRTVGKRGQIIREKQAQTPSELAATATVKHSLLRTGGNLQIQRRDLHQRERLARCTNLIFFVVDCSGSMAARKRMEVVKGAIEQLLDNAYQERDQVAVITFAGEDAVLCLPPTRSIDEAHTMLAEIETGGRTPLSGALNLLGTLTANLHERDGRPLAVVLTDGRANVADGQGDPWQESVREATRIKESGLANIVIDTESGYMRLGKGRELAQASGGEYVLLDELSAQGISMVINRYLKRGLA